MSGSQWQQRIGRRRALQAGGSLSLGVAGWALVGCGEDDEDPPAATGTTTGTAAPGTASPAPEGTGTEEPTAGGSLRVGMLADITSLEPHLALPDHTDTIDQVWEKLTEYDTNLAPTGRLAESWDVSEDQTEFVFHLREGVTFHSGREFTSEDVEYSLARIADPNTSFAQLSVFARWYEEIEAPDDHTIVMRSSVPRPSTFDFLEFFNIGDRESLEAGDATKAVGTGPYMFREWRQGDRFALDRNPNYWEPGAALLDEQIFSVSLDPQTMVTQFESGGLEVMRNPPLRDFVRLRDSGEYQALLHELAGGYYMCGWSVLNPPFDDARVRQAFQWALDRDSFASITLQNTADAYSLPWPESSIAYNEDQANHYQFDLDKAKSLLDAAGVSDLDMDIHLSTAFPELIEFAELYQADLAKIGINAHIQTEEVAAFIERINADPPNFNGMWFISNSRANLGNPITQFLWGVTWRTDGDSPTGYSHPEYTRLIDALTLESNPDEQRRLYRELNAFILDETFIGVIGSRPPRAMLQPNVQGVTSAPARDGFEYRYASLG